MLRHIVTLLSQKGYQKFREEEGIFFRETEKMVYVVTLSVYNYKMRTEDYQNVKMRVEFFSATTYRKPVKMLHLMVTENGMFDEEVAHIVEQTEGIWLIARDTGKIYLFENQSERFDDLYPYLEDGLKNVSRKRKKSSFKLTPVNTAFVALNILCFLGVIIWNKGYYAVYDTEIMLKMGASSYQTFMDGRWYEVITSLFLHFGMDHLLNNMILLTYAGCELENRIGSFWYFILYMFTGICGNFLSLWHYYHIGELTCVSAGASGAIFGVIGVLFVVLLISGKKTGYLTPGRLLFLALINIYYGVTAVGVDNAAHIGGFLSGIIGGFLLSKISQYGKLK